MVRADKYITSYLYAKKGAVVGSCKLTG